MKKRLPKKLKLAKETLVNLESLSLDDVHGAATENTICATRCVTNCFTVCLTNCALCGG